MNAVSAITGSTPYSKASSPAPSAAPPVAPVPAAAVTLSAQAQTALASSQAQPKNIIWGS